MTYSKSLYRERIGRLALWQWLTMLGVLALILRLIVVFRISLWIDDGATLNTVNLPWNQVVPERFQMGHFPWFFLAFKFWHDLAGETLLALRTPSLLATMLAMPLTAGLGARLAGARGALIAAAIYAVHGSMLRHAAELRMYSWMGFLGAGLLLTALRHIEKPTWKRATVFGLFHLALLQLHIGAALFTLPAFIVLTILAWRARLPRTWWRQYAAAFFVPILLTVPVVAYLSQHVDMGEYEKFERIPDLKEFFTAIYELTISLGERPRKWEYILGFGFPLVCLATVWLFRRGKPALEDQPLPPTGIATFFFAAAFAGPVFAYIMTLCGVQMFGQPRYYITGTCGLIALAAGAGGSLRWSKDWRVLLPTLFFLLAAGATTEKMYNRSRDVLGEHGMGLNIMAEEIEDVVPPGTSIIISDTRQVPAIAYYYFGKDAPYQFIECSRKLGEEQVYELLKDKIGPNDDVVLYLYRELHHRVPKVVWNEFGPWADVRESSRDQPKWMYFMREKHPEVSGMREAKLEEEEE